MSVRRAQDERIEGTPDGNSAITEISDVPDTPAIGTATNVGTSRAYNNGAATVTITANATGGEPTSYTVTSTPGSFTGSGTSPVTVTGLASQTSYTFTAVATNSTGTSSATSASNQITATTVPQAPTIGTATAGNTSASVTFTAGATGGSAITGYTVTSSPGSITGTGSSSPITVSGLTNDTSYTFTVTATNANGTSTASSASNTATPTAPVIGLLGSWTSGTSAPVSLDTAAYWGWNRPDGTSPRVYQAGNSRDTMVYWNDGRGGSWSNGNHHPQGGLLGPSSKSYTGVSNRFYTFGADTGSQTSCYSTANGSTWRTENSNSYSAGWGVGTYFTNGGTNYLLSVGDYPSGTPASIATIASNGTVSFSSYTSYPIYKAAGNAQRLTSKAVVMGGYTSGLASTQTNVYSTTGGGSWVSETGLPSASGVPITFSLTGSNDSRIYFWNGTTLYSRGDTSGTWRTETTPSGSGLTGGWGTVDSSGTMYIQLSNGQYQLIS